MPESEIGRELKPSELVPETVVIIMKEGSGQAASVWVGVVTDTDVFFIAGVARVVLGLYRNGEVLTDGSGAVIRVYEYLGEP